MKRIAAEPELLGAWASIFGFEIYLVKNSQSSEFDGIPTVPKVSPSIFFCCTDRRQYFSSIQDLWDRCFGVPAKEQKGTYQGSCATERFM